MLEAEGASVRVLTTSHPGHTRQLGRHERLEDIDCLCAIGGDGTAHELVNGFLARPDNDEARHRLVLGLVPGGSGNTLAYDLKIPTPDDFVRQLLAGVTRAVDAVEITAGPGSAADGAPPALRSSDTCPRRCFSINMIGWGLPAQVLDTANRLRWCGAAQYNLAAYLSLARNARYAATVTLVDEHDRDVSITDEYVMVQAQTTVHMGDKLPFCPNAKLDDGLVDLVALRHAARLPLVRLMAQAKAGRHVASDYTTYYQCKSFTITPAPGEPFTGDGTVNVDGELVGATPLRARVLPAALRLVAG